MTGWQAIIADSDLPDPAKRVIGEVVRHTRLWRGERAEVAVELVAHFADGLDAGQTLEQLLTSFGDPRQAARLIRRAKKRNRAWWWQGMRRFAQFVGVVVWVYVGLAVWLMMDRPHPSVDYLAKLNVTAEAVPADDQAWPIYRKAWIEAKFRDLKLDELQDAEGHWLRPGDEGWGKVTSFLDGHAALVDAIRRGGLKPGLGLSVGFNSDYTGENRLALFGPGEEGQPANQELENAGNGDSEHSRMDRSLMMVLLPNLNYMRKMPNLLMLDMREAARLGDGQRIVTDYRAMIGIARQTREVTLLINQLVAWAIIKEANQTLAGVIQSNAHVLSGEQLTQLAHESVAADAICVVDFSVEQTGMLDVIQRIYSDDGHGDGHLTYVGLRTLTPIMAYTGDSDHQGNALVTVARLPAAYFVCASRKQMTEETDRIFDSLRSWSNKPLWVQLRGQSPVDKRLVEIESSLKLRTRYFLIAAMMPALDRVSQVSGETRAVNRVTGIAIALELYQRQQGAYPQTLESLVPRYAPMMPVDDSTGKPLLYVVRDGRPVLYGRGLDGDDDGGVWDGSTVWPHLPTQGDWVLYPPPGDS